MEVAFRRREQEVWQACDDLWALHGDAKHLTGDAIRERLVMLGKSRGSPNEIYKYRKSWSQSRRIDSNSGTEHFEDNDPITRAVRMVHEKLLGEADEKIEELKTNFDAQLLIKQQELAQKQADLGQVINELGHSNAELSKTQSELKESEQLLIAEIEVRKALERELAYAKASHQKILEELKIAHKNMCEHLAQIYAQQSQEKQALIERLESEKKQLGFEFSDKLTEIKTANYSQALIIKNLQTDLAKQATLLEEKTQVITSQDSKLKITFEEYAHIKSLNHALVAKIEQLDAVQALSQREFHKAYIRNKKNEITIARLRATQAFVGGHYGPGIAAKKRAAPRIIASSTSATKNPESSISVQDSCSQ